MYNFTLKFSLSKPMSKYKSLLHQQNDTTVGINCMKNGADPDQKTHQIHFSEVE